MADKNPFWNKLTKAIRDSVIEKELQQLSLQETFFKDTEFKFVERLKLSYQLFELFPIWISEFVSGLENFKETYITNGNTDALTIVLLNKQYKKIYTLPDEYMFYTHLAESLQIPQKYFTPTSLDLLSKDGIVCLSVPASYNGAIEENQVIIDYCQANDIPLFIDVAYSGLTDPGSIKIKQSTETYLAFSFSKTLGLAFNRIGLLYSDKAIVSISIMNKIGYVNLSGVAAVLQLIKKIPYDYIFKTYKDQYQDICKEHNLTPTKCILFAKTSKDEKYGIAEYYKLK